MLFLSLPLSHHIVCEQSTKHTDNNNPFIRTTTLRHLCSVHRSRSDWKRLSSVRPAVCAAKSLGKRTPAGAMQSRIDWALASVRLLGCADIESPDCLLSEDGGWSISASPTQDNPFRKRMESWTPETDFAVSCDSVPSETQPPFLPCGRRKGPREVDFFQTHGEGGQRTPPRVGRHPRHRASSCCFVPLRYEKSVPVSSSSLSQQRQPISNSDPPRSTFFGSSFRNLGFVWSILVLCVSVFTHHINQQQQSIRIHDQFGFEEEEEECAAHDERCAPRFLSLSLSSLLLCLPCAVCALSSPQNQNDSAHTKPFQYIHNHGVSDPDTHKSTNHITACVGAATTTVVRKPPTRRGRCEREREMGVLLPSSSLLFFSQSSIRRWTGPKEVSGMDWGFRRHQP